MVAFIVFAVGVITSISIGSKESPYLLGVLYLGLVNLISSSNYTELSEDLVQLAIEGQSCTYFVFIVPDHVRWLYNFFVV